MRSRALFSSLLLVSAACGAPATMDVGWRVVLPDGGASGAVVVHADVHNGARCDRPADFSFDVPVGSGMPRGMPTTTAGGLYCICVEARDAMCRPVASVCEQVTLPTTGTVVITLEPETMTQPSACPGTCSAGLCGMDAGVMDGGVRDLPATDAPTADVPAIDAPATDMPGTDMPGTDLGMDGGTDLGTDSGPPPVDMGPSCTLGCLAGTTCNLGVTGDACGRRGGGCTACTGECSAGICAPVPSHDLTAIASFQLSGRIPATVTATVAGADTYLQLGARSSGVAFGTATLTSAHAVEFYDLGATQFATCATTNLGEMYCWGTNDYGLLARGTPDGTMVTATPTLVTRPAGMPTNDWALIDGGSQHFCAIRRTGALSCWGDNARGQLGVGSGLRTEPTVVGSGIWIAVSAGDVNTCAVRQDGRLWCWGDNAYGQVGSGTMGAAFVGVPTEVSGSLTDWIAVSVEGTHACGIREVGGTGAGTLWCWGDQRNGQLGIGTVSTPQTTPQQVGSATDWTAVSAGQFHTCGLRGNQAYCWGGSAFGELGDGSTSTQLIPEVLAGTWSAVTAGWHMTCGVQTSSPAGTYCWGQNAGAKLGIGQDPAVTMYVFSPTPTM